MSEQKRMFARDLNIDLIRVAACFLVISVHFFPNTGFYAQPIQGTAMFILTLIRNFSMICVPLFMLLTGCLSGHFSYDKKHILRFAHILIVYFLSTMVCKLYRIFFLGHEFSIKEWIFGLIDFSGAPYAWYVEMYLGMLMMIPFLNAGWSSMTRMGRRMTILGFLVLSGMHTVVPDRQLFDYWSALYPLTYYCIGAYLAENKPKIQTRYWALLLFASAVLLALGSYVRDYGENFRALPFTGYNSVYVLAVSVLFFQMVRSLNLSALPGGVCRLIRMAAKATLPAYLVSYCFDCSLYERLCLRVPLASDQLPYYFLLVPINFIGSLLIGYVVALLGDLLFKPVRVLVNRLSSCMHAAQNQESVRTGR